MVARKDLFEAADRLAKEHHVTQRLLQETLKGSFDDIGPLLNEWKGANDYDTKLGKAGVPLALHAAVARAAGGLWKAAKALAEDQLKEERRDLAAQAKVAELGHVTASELRAQLDDVRAKMKALEERCKTAEALAQRYRAEEFWDRVMQAIAKIMPPEGTMSGKQVLSVLSTNFRKECLSHKEDWTTKTLYKKMYVRSEHTNYFTMLPGGRFGRIENVDGEVAPNTDQARSKRSKKRSLLPASLKNGTRAVRG